MSDIDQRFIVGDRPRLEVRLPSGELRVTSGPEGAIEMSIDGGDPSKYTLEQIGDKVVFVAQSGGFFSRGSFDLTVTVPAATEIEAKLGSADLGITGKVSSFRGSVASGDVRIEELADSSEIKIASGDVNVGHAASRLDVSSASGEIRVGRVDGDIKVHSASGDLRIKEAGAQVEMKSAAGDVRIGSFEGRKLVAKSLSGDVSVGIPQGRTVYLDVQTTSGDVRNGFDFVDSGDTTGRAEIKVKTLSGDIILRSAG